MAEENTNVEGMEQVNQAQAEEPKPERTFTQAEVDAIVKQRLERASRKASNDGGAEVAKQLEETQAELAKLRADVERSRVVSAVATEFGVPADLLHGETEEALRSNAAALKEWRESRPASFPATNEGSSKPPVAATKESIMAIKDPVERRAAIAANLALFNR